MPGQMGLMPLSLFCNHRYHQDGKQLGDDSRAPLKHAATTPKPDSPFLLHSMLSHHELSHQVSCHGPCPWQSWQGIYNGVDQPSKNSAPTVGYQLGDGDQWLSETIPGPSRGCTSLPWRALVHPEAQRYNCFFLANSPPSKK